MRRVVKYNIYLLLLLLCCNSIILEAKASTVIKGEGQFVIPITVGDAVVEHKHNYNKVTIVPPTCTVQGHTLYACNCGDAYITDIVKKLGHDEGVWIITQEATMWQNGEVVRKCTRCGEVLEKKVLHKLKNDSLILLPPGKVKIPVTVYYEDLPVIVQDFKEGSVRPTLVPADIKQEQIISDRTKDKKSSKYYQDIEEDSIKEVSSVESESGSSINKNGNAAANIITDEDWSVVTKSVKKDSVLIVYLILIAVSIILTVSLIIYNRKVNKGIK